MPIPRTIVTSGDQTAENYLAFDHPGGIDVFQWRSRWFQHEMESLSDRVAQRCRATTLHRVLPEAIAMTPAESRGYIRARASRIVAFHSELLVIELGGGKELVPRLISLAKRRVVALVLENLTEYRRALGIRHRAA